jgi:hypothetical protein
MNEADTCRKEVRPRLEAAGWDTPPHLYNEQTSFTDGRIVVAGTKVRRKKQKGTGLFSNRSGPTQDVRYYEHPLPEGRKQYTKTQPLQYEEFAPCLAWWKSTAPMDGASRREENERAWKVPAQELLAAGSNLDRKNPRAKADFAHLPPEQLVEDILAKERRIIEIMGEIKKLLGRKP